MKSKKPALKRKAAKVRVALASPETRTATFTLPEMFETSAASTIHQQLLAHRYKALTIEAMHVRRVGTLSLQVMLSAARTWSADGVLFKVENASSELLDAIALLGLTAADFQMDGHAQ